MFPRLCQQITKHTQTGLDVKTKTVDDLTEVVEVTEEVDEQQAIEDEVI